MLENDPMVGGMVVSRSSGVQMEAKLGMQTFAERTIEQLSGADGFWGTAAASVLLNAIVDSGASYTFVTDKVMLERVLPGVGKVWVANGQSEPVAEIGSFGPLTARKVRSFDRTLVSVRDLVDKYGGVYFDNSGVHVVTTVGEKFITSTIGAPTPERLYSFDLQGLMQHDKKVKAKDLKDLDWNAPHLDLSSVGSGASACSCTEGARGRLSVPEGTLTAEQGRMPWCLRVSGLSASCSLSSGAGG